VGWAIGPPDVLKRAVQVRDYTSLALSPLVEVVAQRAIEGADALLAPRLDQARRNLAVVADWMAAHAGKVEWSRPRGGVVAFPRLAAVTDVVALCHRLMAEAGVLLVPGACFGHPAHVRLGFGGPSAALVEGLDQLSSALEVC
jgi:aspartate/methionine/tyrosine aminotransferase